MTSNQQPKSETKSSACLFFGKALKAAVWFLVVLVLFVLASAVFGPFYGRGEAARPIAAVTQIAAFSTALDTFEADNNYYPKGSNGLKDLVTQPSDAPSWHGPYLKEIPKDPWQHDYIYQCPGQHNTNAYDLSSMGPNGRAGDKDDITNWRS